MDYKKLIIEMAKKIESQKILIKIYTFISEWFMSVG